VSEKNDWLSTQTPETGVTSTPMGTDREDPCDRHVTRDPPTQPNGSANPRIRTSAWPAATGTAISQDGQVSVRTISYFVMLPDNHFTIEHIKTYPDGAISFKIKVPGPGTLDVLGTAWNDNLAHVAVLLGPATRRFVYARKQPSVESGHIVRLRVRPNARGCLLVGHHAYGVTLRLWVS
jgi:hypothetical protein